MSLEPFEGWYDWCHVDPNELDDALDDILYDDDDDDDDDDD